MAARLPGRGTEARAPAGPEKTRLWSASLRALPELKERELRSGASERYGAPALAARVAQDLGLQHRFIEIDNPA